MNASWKRIAFAVCFSLVAGASGIRAAEPTLDSAFVGYPSATDPLREALHESFAAAFPPGDLSVDDFRLDWEGPALPGVEARLLPESLQWVRVHDVLVVPRARVSVSGLGSAALVSYQGSFVPATSGAAEFPVALSVARENALEVRAVVDGKERAGKLVWRFEPRERAPRVFVDASCSPWRVQVKPTSAAAPGSWMSVGCRLVRSPAEGETRPSLDVSVYWDQPDAGIRVAGVSVPTLASREFTVKLRPGSGEIPIANGRNEEYALSASLPDRLRRGSFGAGLGPYRYRMESRGLREDRWVPFVTMYGSLTISDPVRLTFFNGTAVTKHFFSDTGLYLNSESFRAFDNRLQFTIMLGANLIGFGFEDESRFKIGIPQGFEFMYRDFLAPRWNLHAGAFIYPKINDKSYYNLWLRYGANGKFVELNYISIEDRLGDRPVFTRSAGISFGMPLAKVF